MREKRPTIASFQQGVYFSSTITSSFKNFQVIFKVMYINYIYLKTKIYGATLGYNKECIKR